MEGEKISGLTELVAFGSMGMIILIVFIFIFIIMDQKKAIRHRLQLSEKETDHQRQLLQSTITVEEKERERMSKNLHDDIGTYLNVLKLHITKMERNVENTELVSGLISESKHLLENTIQEVRNISKDLMPPLLLNLGLQKAVSELCRSICHSGTVEAVCHVSGSDEVLPIPVQQQLFRIINEVLNNIIKHAAAGRIEILFSQDSRYTVRITHNGKGISNEEIQELINRNHGIGLKSIVSRLYIIEGKIDYFVSGKEGAGVMIEIPLTKK